MNRSIIGEVGHASRKDDLDHRALYSERQPMNRSIIGEVGHASRKDDLDHRALYSGSTVTIMYFHVLLLSLDG